MRRWRWRWRWLWLVGVLSVAILIGGIWAWQYVNRLAHERVTLTLREATGLNVHVGKTTVATTGVECSNVTIGDATSPVLFAEKMRVEAPLRELAGEQPKIDSIQFQAATLFLRANSDGVLEWPFKSRGVNELPSDQVDIVNGTIILSQPQHDDFVATGVELTIEQQDGDVHIEGGVRQCLDGQWRVAGTIVGGDQINITFSTDEFSARSNELTKKAIVSKLVRAVPFELNGSATVKLVMSEQQQKFSATISLGDASISVPNVELRLTDASAEVEIDDREFVIREFFGAIGNGQVHATAVVDVQQMPYRGRFEMGMNNVQANAVRNLIMAPDYVSGNATGEFSGRFQLAGNETEIMGRGSGTIENAVVREIPLEPLTTQVTISDLHVGPDALASIQGSVEFSEIKVVDVPIEKLMSLLPPSVANAIPDVRGRVTANGELTIPLQTAMQPATWNASATVTSESLQFTENSTLSWTKLSGTLEASSERLAGSSIELTSVSSGLRVVDSQIIIDHFSADALGDGHLQGNGRIPLDSQQVGKAELAVERIPLEYLMDFGKRAVPHFRDVLDRIASSLGDDDAQVTGNASITARVAVAMADVRNMSAWSGQVIFQLGEASVFATDFTSIGVTLALEDGQLQLRSGRAKLAAGGEIVAKGSLPLLDDDADAQTRITWSELPIQLVSQLSGITSSPTGRFSGRLRLVAGSGRLADVNGRGDIVVKRLAFGDATINDISADVYLAHQRLQLRNIKVGVVPQLSARFAIETKYPFRYSASLRGERRSAKPPPALVLGLTATTIWRSVV